MIRNIPAVSSTNNKPIHHKRHTRRHHVFWILLYALTLPVSTNADPVIDAESNDPSVNAEDTADSADGGDTDDNGDAGTPDTAQETPDDRTATVCLSPGHPSHEGDKSYEAVLNRKVAYKLKKRLLQAGYNVVISTEDLTEQELFSPEFDNEDESNRDNLIVQTPEEKAEICNVAGADYVISIHHNYSYNPAVNHTMVFYGVDDRYRLAHEEAKQWAQITARFLSRAMKTDGSKVYADMKRLGFPLGIVANSKAPAILTEAAFYSNPKERKRLNRNDYIEKEAQAIFDAFHTHYQSVNP